MSKILVVDDSKLARRFLTTPLRNAGHEVLEAKNGQEGLATFARLQALALSSSRNLQNGAKSHPVTSAFDILLHTAMFFMMYTNGSHFVTLFMFSVRGLSETVRTGPKARRRAANAQ